MDKNGRVLDLKISRLGASWRPLGPISIFFWRSWGASWARPGAVRVPPEAFPERFGGYFLVCFVMMIIYIIKSVFLKNRRFMLVKRTILKVHLLALAILDPILSTCSSFEHQYTSRSIQLHLGNAVCHMSDTLPDPFFSIMIGPKTDLKKISAQQDGNKFFLERFPGGVGNGSRRGTQNRNYQGVIFFPIFLFFLFFFKSYFKTYITNVTTSSYL